jgi:hypothetical protein
MFTFLSILRGVPTGDVGVLPPPPGASVCDGEGDDGNIDVDDDSDDGEE